MDWIFEKDRLARFIEKIVKIPGLVIDRKLDLQPPISSDHLTNFEHDSNICLPTELKEFFVQCASSLEFSYYCANESLDADVFGGIMLNYSSIKELDVMKREWMSDTWIAEDQIETEAWRITLPFTKLKNGDFLGVLTEGNKEGQVIYLAHDDQSAILAPSFFRFWKEWSECSYLGPELWLLENCINIETGYVDGNSEYALYLRNFFRSN